MREREREKGVWGDKVWNRAKGEDELSKDGKREMKKRGEKDVRR